MKKIGLVCLTICSFLVWTIYSINRQEAPDNGVSLKTIKKSKVLNAWQRAIANKPKDIKTGHQVVEEEIYPHGAEGAILSNPFSESKIGRKVASHFKTVQAWGPDAESQYQESLNELRTERDEAVKELWSAYQNLEEQRYEERQQVVQTLLELGGPNSLKPFKEIALADIPEEKYPDLHMGSTQLEEGIIRLTAIEGLGKHLEESESQEEAKEVLIEILSSDKNLALKRQASREYLQKADGPLAEKEDLLKKVLPESQHSIVTAQVDSPENQAQPEIDNMNQSEEASDNLFPSI